MRIVRDHTSVSEKDRGAVVAIGNFDGVHRGHQSVIGLAEQQAALLGKTFGVITFEPHPRQFFKPGGSQFRLMSAGAKARRLALLDVAVLYELSFGRELAQMPADVFVSQVLVNGLEVAGVVAGEDFRFGRGRQGTVDSLAELSRRHGFALATAPILEDSGRALSSTSVRQALSEGRVRQAAEILGHWHRIEGVVIKGEQRGRELGFPTANVDLTGLHPPRLGVYSVLADILTGGHKGRYKGVASIGVRPTFGANPLNLEMYFFGLEADIYGEEISVALIEFQRPEIAFANVRDLVEQMKRDCDQSRTVLAELA